MHQQMWGQLVCGLKYIVTVKGLRSSTYMSIFIIVCAASRTKAKPFGDRSAFVL